MGLSSLHLGKYRHYQPVRRGEEALVAFFCTDSQKYSEVRHHGGCERLRVSLEAAPTLFPQTDILSPPSISPLLSNPSEGLLTVPSKYPK